MEDILTANWWSNPWLWVLKLTKRKLRASITECVVELSDRYNGILYQILRQGGCNDDRLIQDFITGVWLSMQDRARNLEDYRQFSTSLWKVCEVQARVLPPPSLKPKLMLRQFVDEMPSCDERGVLRILAYGPLDGSHSNQESLNLLSRAYPILHDQVLSHIDDIECLTDSAITPNMVRDMEAPFVQYEIWLFPPSDIEA